MTRVVITGAGRGIGHALAIGYLDRGREVWAGCRSPERAPGLAGRGALVRRLDVTDEETVRRFAADIAAAGEVNVLINAAGIDARALGAAPGRRGPFEIDAEHFLGEMRVNAAGPMLVTRALLPQLTHGSSAKVINLSSRLASMTVGAELCWDIGYNASKAALNAVTVRTAKLLDPAGVIVVAVHPGWVRTAMGGPEAVLSPEEAAGQLIETIDSLNREHSGLFLNRDGTPRPW
jgi:NAD(P)-dependent dehydrogenase (short-subunit alcohol dehydrogenase family)